MQKRPLHELYHKLYVNEPKGPGKIYWGHGVGAKGYGANLFFFFIALKHRADTFSAVSGHGADTFFHYLETKEKLFTEKKFSCSYIFTEVADNH